MNFLFVHQNFPGQYLHLINHLLLENRREEAGHLLVFMTEDRSRGIPGVTKVVRKAPVDLYPNTRPKVHSDCHEFDQAMKRSKSTFHAATHLKDMGFKPDIIIGHHGWGELLSIRDVFPNTPVLGYFEFFYHSDKNDATFDEEFPIPHERWASVRAKNAINLLALSLNQHGQTPTKWQKSTYPTWSHSSIRILEEGVPLNLCLPDPEIKSRRFKLNSLLVEQNQKLVTYAARNLEPYRGFHTFMRALPRILHHAPEAVVAILGGDGVSYGATHQDGPWRTVLLHELAGKIDLGRVHFLGLVSHNDHLRLLKRSDIHVYLSYPFVASWSLREALASGCTVVGFDNIMTQEFITHQENGILIRSLSTSSLEAAVCYMLSEPSLAASLGRAARRHAMSHLDNGRSITINRQYIDSIVHPPSAASVRLPVSSKEAPTRAVYCEVD